MFRNVSDSPAVRVPHARGMTSASTAQLTPREKQVAVLLAYGFTNAEVARRLSISVRTAEMHRAGAMRKLGATSRAHLVRWALDQGLLH